MDLYSTPGNPWSHDTATCSDIGRLPRVSALQGSVSLGIIHLLSRRLDFVLLQRSILLSK